MADKYYEVREVGVDADWVLHPVLDWDNRMTKAGAARAAEVYAEEYGLDESRTVEVKRFGKFRLSVEEIIEYEYRATPINPRRKSKKVTKR